MAFTVDITDLRAHADHLDWLIERLSDATTAAGTRHLTPDTYGWLSEPLIPLLVDLQDNAMDAVTTGTRTTQHLAGAVRNTAEDYDDVDSNNKNIIESAEKPPDPPPPRPGDLVAKPEHRSVQLGGAFTKIDGEHWHEGIDVLEGLDEVISGIVDKKWDQVGLGAISTVVEGVNIGIDPVPTFTKYGLGWLGEHIGPWQWVLDQVTANQAVVTAEAETWNNIRNEVDSIGNDYKLAVQNDLSVWEGRGADGYRAAASVAADMFKAIGKGADGIAAALQIYGDVVDIVRDVINDLLAELIAFIIARLPIWLAEASTGVGAPAVAAKATALGGRYIAKAIEILKKLVASYQRLAKYLKPLKDLLERIKKYVTPFEKAEKTGRAGQAFGEPDEARKHAEQVRSKGTYAEEA